MFVKWTGDSEKTIYVFEPDEKNFRTCQRILEEMDGVPFELIFKGLWSKETILDFCASANEGSIICRYFSGRMERKRFI